MNVLLTMIVHLTRHVYQKNVETLVLPLVVVQGLYAKWTHIQPCAIVLLASKETLL